MKRPQESTPPAGSLIEPLLPGAYFHDAWCIRAGDPGLSAYGQFLKVFSSGPRWVDASMRLRNRVVSWLGLKDLGAFSAVDQAKCEAHIQPGDRVGIFTLYRKTPDEVLAGDRDRHLDVMVSVYRREISPGEVVVTVTTVVHVHNRLGRIYMLFVKPMHRIIAPATVKSLARA